MQLCQGKPLPPRQRVSPGDGDAVAILPQREKIAAVQPLTGVAGTDKEVKFLSQGADLSQNPLVVVLIGDEVELVAGEVPAEAVPQVHKGPAGIEDGGSHTKGRPGRLGGRPRLPQRPVRVGEHLSGVAVNDLSRRGQDGPPPCALQQLQLQVPLQGVELLHHRRGREVELFRRLAEAAAVGHADKGGQLGVEHGRSSLPFKLLVDTMVQNRRFPVKPARLKIGANNRRWNIRLAGEEIAP